ncbi:MAG: nuclear transport factor 2 family protein [Spirosomaceae bacterium]|nr:nuclear transport factor 2 family protein [Spirosomataceae bacterium]
MKHFKIIVVALLSVNVAVFAQSEEAAIKQTVLDYLDGGTNGDVARFKKAFVSDAIQRSVGRNGTVSGMTVESLASKIKPGSVMNRQTKIVSWSYANDAATAITETAYETSKIIDLLNLLKVNGEWKIVSRVFSRMELNEEVASSSGSMSLPVSTSAKAVKAAPAKKKPVVSDDGW